MEAKVCIIKYTKRAKKKQNRENRGKKDNVI